MPSPSTGKLCMHAQQESGPSRAAGMMQECVHCPAGCMRVRNDTRKGLAAPLQVLVDIATPPEAFQSVDAAVTTHFAANPGEFTGSHIVVANFASDPLKYTLCVWWEFSHPGASSPRASACYCCPKPSLHAWIGGRARRHEQILLSCSAWRMGACCDAEGQISCD